MSAVRDTTISPQPGKGSEPKSFWSRYSFVIGLTMLVFILVPLFSTPEQMTAEPILFIDSELNRASEGRATVLAKMDLSNSEQLRKFPTEIGDWRGSDFDTTAVERFLNPDCLLMRSYSKPGLFQAIFFVVSQSKLKSSIHPPSDCYPSLGYTIEEEGQERIPIVNTGWAAKPPQDWPSIYKNPEYGTLYFWGSIPAKKLVVFRQSNGEVIERRVVLYFYMKDNELTSTRMTLIRISALAPLTGSYDNIMNIEKEFVSDAFPHMFEVSKKKRGEINVVRLVKSGVGGCLLVAFLFSIPVVILISPRIHRLRLQRRRNQREET